MELKAMILGGLMVACVPFATMAQSEPARPITLVLKAEKEVKKTLENGTSLSSLIPADKVLPGETVLYTITYSNNGEKPASGIVVRNPIPVQMLYLDGSATGEGTDIQFSVDGGQTYKPAAELMISLPDGTTRPAEPSEYNSIRWTVLQPVEGGQSGSVSYRAVLK